MELLRVTKPVQRSPAARSAPDDTVVKKPQKSIGRERRSRHRWALLRRERGDILRTADFHARRGGEGDTSCGPGAFKPAAALSLPGDGEKGWRSSPGDGRRRDRRRDGAAWTPTRRRVDGRRRHHPDRPHATCQNSRCSSASRRRPSRVLLKRGRAAALRMADGRGVRYGRRETTMWCAVLARGVGAHLSGPFPPNHARLSVCAPAEGVSTCRC